MSLLDAMTVLAQEWDDVQRRLGPAQALKLDELVAQFVDEDDPRTSSNIAEDIMDLLVEGLPVAHPVLQALAGPQDRFEDLSSPAADSAWLQLATLLLRRLKAPAPPERSGTDGAGSADPSFGGGPPGTSIGDDSDDDG